MSGLNEKPIVVNLNMDKETTDYIAKHDYIKIGNKEFISRERATMLVGKQANETSKKAAEALPIDDVMPRFILDIRSGCAAIRDTKHPKYNKEYQGLHRDTSDVVEYIHGFQNHEKKRWDILPENIKYLTDYCASLNGA